MFEPTGGNLEQFKFTADGNAQTDFSSSETKISIHPGAFPAFRTVVAT